MGAVPRTAVPDEPTGADAPPSRPGPAAASGWSSSGRSRPARATRASTPSSPGPRSAPGCAPASGSPASCDHLRPGGAALRRLRGLGQVGHRRRPPERPQPAAGAGSGARPTTRPSARRRPARRQAGAARPTASRSPGSTSPSSTRTGSWSRASPRRTSGTRRATTRTARCPARSATSPSPATATGPPSGGSTSCNDGDAIVVETQDRLVRLQGVAVTGSSCRPRSRWWRRCPASRTRSRPRRCSP